MLILLLQESWWPGVNTIWIIITVVVMVIIGLIIILSKQREEVQALDKRRGDAANDLVKTLDRRIEELEKELAAEKEKNRLVNEELEDTTVELRTVTGIKLAKLVLYWKEYEQHVSYMRSLEANQIGPHSPKRLEPYSADEE